MTKSNRDNFSKRIVTSLAGRVGYLCSNPFCRRSTIGPNTIRDKITLIGIAAHITAASPGGPRYDSNLTDTQRKDIDNGIWLCSNCSTLIDRDEKGFTVNTLKTWRNDAELYAARQLSHGSVIIHSIRPKIEVSLLLWQRGFSWNQGLISQEVDTNGHIAIEEAKFLFENTRFYKLQLINNTSITAVNLRIKQVEGPILTIPEEKLFTNNLKPFEEKDIECSFITSYIMTGSERAVFETAEQGYPTELSKVQLQITYGDEHGQEFQTLTSFSGRQPNNILT